MSCTAVTILATALALGCPVLPAAALKPQTAPSLAGAPGGEHLAGGQVAGVGREGHIAASHGGNWASNRRLKTREAEVSAKWEYVRSRMRTEEETIAACRMDLESCSQAARSFLDIVELGRQREGRARLGEINRAVNLRIKPVDDWVQHGVDDFWSTPLATLAAGAGDCEDYAILKYAALRELGVAADDLRVIIVRDIRRSTNHAVLAVRDDEQWLILDNRTLVLVKADDVRQYLYLVVLDRRGARSFEEVAFR